MKKACLNTDKEIWRKTKDTFSPTIFITKRKGVGIEVGGTVNVKTIEKWHELAEECEVYKGVIDDLTRAYAYLQKEYKIMAEYYTGDGLCACGSPLAPPSCPQCELKSNI